MYYIYTLSFNGIPFYAGVTNDPLNRFRGHYYWNDCWTYNFVRYNLMAFNKYADMDFIACCKDKSEAWRIEYHTILFLSKAGFMLLNKVNISFNKLLKPEDYPPKYPHFKSLPDKWCNSTTRANIIKKQVKIRTEYEQQG